MLLNIGHRGASGTKPENTLEAFTHALSLGADGIELDVRRCGSGELVVVHDAFLGRLIREKGRISSMELAQLQSLQMDGGGHIPTLEETFLIVGKEATIFIELKKHTAVRETALLIKRYIAQGWQASKLILICFNHDVLTQAQKIFPALATGASFTRLTRRSVRKTKRLGASYIIAQHNSVKPKHVALARQLGLKLIVWTVNSPEDIAHAKTLGVDGIMSDYPERVK